MKNTQNKQMYQHYLVILKNLKGFSNKPIAENLNLCQHTVGSYIRKYKKEGILGLDINHSPSTTRMLTKEQEVFNQ